MAFTKPPNPVPVAIGTVTIILRDVPASGSAPARQEIAYVVDVLDASGERIDYNAERGNLEPLLTANQVTQLKAFMTAMRTKAVTELLG